MNNEAAEAMEQVTACEQRRCRALVERDLATLDTLVRDDLVHIHATGSVDDRVGYLKGVETAIEFLTVERQNLSVRIYEDVAVMTGGLQQTIRIVRTGAEHVMNAMATQVWVREDGEWKQASFHACIIK